MKQFYKILRFVAGEFILLLLFGCAWVALGILVRFPWLALFALPFVYSEIKSDIYWSKHPRDNVRRY